MNRCAKVFDGLYLSDPFQKLSSLEDYRTPAWMKYWFYVAKCGDIINVPCVMNPVVKGKVKNHVAIKLSACKCVTKGEVQVIKLSTVTKALLSQLTMCTQTRLLGVRLWLAHAKFGLFMNRAINPLDCCYGD